MPNPNLICFGDLCADILVQADNFPQPGQDATARYIALLPGGSAANCAVTAARLGITTHFVGITGQDFLSDALVNDLRRNGVGIDYLRRVDGPTGTVVAILSGQSERHGERTFFSFRGANALPYGPPPADLIGPADCLHLSGYSFQDEQSWAGALALAQQAKSRGALVSLDPSFQFAHAQATSILADLDFIFPNLDEARLLSGAQAPAEAAAGLRALGPKTVVVKLGAEGCYIASAAVNAHVAAYHAPRVVDSTGAGDAFCGGFLAGILRGLPVLDAARLGHAAAVHVIGALGGHQAAPTRADLTTFAAENDPALHAALDRLENAA